MAGDGSASIKRLKPGDAFVQSHGCQSIKDAAARPTKWSSGPVEVKAELFESDRGDALVQPEAQPGIQQRSTSRSASPTSWARPRRPAPRSATWPSLRARW